MTIEWNKSLLSGASGNTALVKPAPIRNKLLIGDLALFNLDSALNIVIMWPSCLCALYIALVRAVKLACVRSGEIKELLRRGVLWTDPSAQSTLSEAEWARDDGGLSRANHPMSFRAERSGVEKSIDFPIRLPPALHLH